MQIWRQKIIEWRKLYSQRNSCFYHFLLLTIWQVCKSTISNSALQRFFTMMAYYMKAKTNAYQSVSSILHNKACLSVKLSSHLFPNINQSAYSTLDNQRQSKFDWVANKHYWEIPINKNTTPMLTCPTVTKHVIILQQLKSLKF